MPKVSIIMGIYNCETTLNEAIDSIVCQTFEDWQLVLCDDGSTDRTAEIAEEYRKEYRDKVILLKNKQNMGLNFTLNRCLEVAEGDYIARMDGDDISLSNRLAEEVRFLDENPQYAIVSTPMIFFDETGEWGRSKAIEKPTKRDFIRHSPVHCHAPCMIRREAMRAVGGYTEDKRLLRFEDVNLWYKLYAKGYRGYNLDKPLYMMRDDQAAIARRGIKSRMNGVYATYVGFKLFRFPWYMYVFVATDAAKHIIKGIIPQKLYARYHRRNNVEW